jgi:hypothetical protein
VNAQNAESTISANTQYPRSAQRRLKTNAVAKKRNPVIAAKMAPLAAAQLSREADPVIEKAKAAIAALMGNPASAQFSRIRRAARILSGESLDTVCGYVKSKNASGTDTGELAFLYIINDDGAYLVDGSSPLAETVHRSLCD